MSSSLTTAATPIGKSRSPWSVWWLSGLTLGVYYLVWYLKLNKEIARATGVDVAVGSYLLCLSQLVPIANSISLAHTARRLATAQEQAGELPTVSARRTILASFWFGSQTRYLQRRANELWHTLENRSATGRPDPLDLIYAYSRAPRALLPGPSQPDNKTPEAGSTVTARFADPVPAKERG